VSPIGAPSIPDQAEEPLAAAPAVERLVDDVARLARDRGRADLATRLGDARDRVARTEVVVCVVGEFKQGKSALINALLGEPVCPVDDDLATIAVTVVRYGESPSATVRRRGPDGPVTEPIPPAEIADWVTERSNPDNRRNVELVELAIPNPYLREGITLIDTPGVGGLNAAHAAATLAFLPLADALVFVTDASAELSGPELEFLGRAREAGRPIVVGFTKTDMYPAWRQILAINEGRLARFDGLRAYPLSAVLRADAVAHDDSGEDADSGFPAFGRDLLGTVAERARHTAAESALAEVATAAGQLRQPVSTELRATEHPEDAERMALELATTRTRLAALNQASSTWSVRLDDEFGALRSRVEFSFHTRMRRITQETQAEIEGLDPGRSWAELSERAQQRVSASVRDAFLEASTGVAGIREVVIELLADEEAAALASVSVDLDVSALWSDGLSFGGGVRSSVFAGFALVAGATVGVEVLGMLGALLGTALVGPALLGATLFFGGKEVVEERRRRLADRRQEARTFIARFVDDVQFEVDGRLQALLGDLQRQLRARVGARIQELLRTARDSASALESSIASSQVERERRIGELRLALDDLDAIASRASALMATDSAREATR
jgi:hypothetical protein